VQDVVNQSANTPGYPYATGFSSSIIATPLLQPMMPTKKITGFDLKMNLERLNTTTKFLVMKQPAILM